MVSLPFGKRRKLRLERVVRAITKWHMGSRALQGQAARACPRDGLTGLPEGPGEPGSRSSALVSRAWLHHILKQTRRPAFQHPQPGSVNHSTGAVGNSMAVPQRIKHGVPQHPAILLLHIHSKALKTGSQADSYTPVPYNSQEVEATQVYLSTDDG